MKIPNNSPRILNISGPYAVGKDTLLNAVIERYPDRTHRVSTVTTRATSPQADPTYQTVSAAEMRNLSLTEDLIVTTQLGGSVLYGTRIAEIEAQVEAGKICVHAIFAGPDGAGRLREVFGSRLFSVGLLAANGGLDAQMEILAERLMSRTRDSLDAVRTRLRYQAGPIEYVLANPSVKTVDGDLPVFDTVLVNDHLESTLTRMIEIVDENFVASERDSR